MARIRTIKPEAFDHEGLYDAEHDTKLPLRWAFAGLWCHADRRGRFEWRPRRLKVGILPHDSCDFSRVLDALTTRGFIRHYACEDLEYGWIPSFQRHQVINNRESESELPPHPEDPDKRTTWTRDPRVTDACLTEIQPCTVEGKGREGKGKEQERSTARVEDAWEGFDAFWDAYPRKAGKVEARKAWAKMRATPALHARILEAIAQQRQCHQWTKDGGQFIPHPATWLSQARWDDEPDRPQSTRTVAQPLPTYDPDWCQHDPRCPSKDWHTIMCARESSHA